MNRSQSSCRAARAVIDLSAISGNVQLLKSLVPAGTLLMAVVKANGYGHGAVEVSRTALDAGAERLGVALLEEGEELRAAGITCPVHLLFEPPPACADRVVQAGLVPTIYSLEMAAALDTAARAAGTVVRVHVKIDTGMRRVGIKPAEIDDYVEGLSGLRGISVEGVYTHLPRSNVPHDRFTEKQLGNFSKAAARLEELLGRRLLRHAANSGGIISYPSSHLDMVRAGISLYGLSPDRDFPCPVPLRPALSIRGELGFVKEVQAGEAVSYGSRWAPGRPTRIGIIPLGYADGLSRILSGKAEVIIDGERRPIVGTICMDACLVDLGTMPVPQGTPFTLIGQDGGEEITADEIAGLLGTINYEVCCMISARVAREYAWEKA